MPSCVETTLHSTDLAPSVPRDLGGPPLHELIRAQLKTLLARFEDEHGGRRIPHHVEEEFQAVLRCCDPTFGFCRIQCRECQAASVLSSPTDCKPSKRRRSWAGLLERTFAEDVLCCPPPLKWAAISHRHDH